MPTVKVPVRIDYPNQGGPGYNIFHARVGDVDTDLANALDALETFYTAMASVWGTTTTITIGEGMIADPYGSPTYVPDDARVIAGTGVANAIPQLLALVVSWRTTAATRSGRGRTFLGPLVQGTWQTDGTPVGDVITGLRGVAEDLVDASQAANGWAFGVYSQKDGVLRDWTGSSVRDQYAYLSSRRD